MVCPFGYQLSTNFYNEELNERCFMSWIHCAGVPRTVPQLFHPIYVTNYLLSVASGHRQGPINTHTIRLIIYTCPTTKSKEDSWTAQRTYFEEGREEKPFSEG